MGKTEYGSPLHTLQSNTGTDSFTGLVVHYITAPSQMQHFKMAQPPPTVTRLKDCPCPLDPSWVIMVCT